MVQRFFRESTTERLRHGVFTSMHQWEVAIYNCVARPQFFGCRIRESAISDPERFRRVDDRGQDA